MLYLVQHCRPHNPLYRTSSDRDRVQVQRSTSHEPLHIHRTFVVQRNFLPYICTAPYSDSSSTILSYTITTIHG